MNIWTSNCLFWKKFEFWGQLWWAFVEERMGLRIAFSGLSLTPYKKYVAKESSSPGN